MNVTSSPNFLDIKYTNHFFICLLFNSICLLFNSLLIYMDRPLSLEFQTILSIANYINIFLHSPLDIQANLRTTEAAT